MPSAKPKRQIKPAEKNQKDVIRFVEGKVPKGLGHNKAKTMIRTYKNDPEKAAKLKEYWDIEEAKDEAKWAKQYAKEERQENINEIRELINEYPDDYGLKKVTNKHVKAALENLESKTNPIDFTGDIYEIVAKVGRQIYQDEPDKRDPKGDGLNSFAYKPQRTFTDKELEDFPIKLEMTMTVREESLPKHTFGKRQPQPDKWAAEKLEQKQRGAVKDSNFCALCILANIARASISIISLIVLFAIFSG